MSRRVRDLPAWRDWKKILDEHRASDHPASKRLARLAWKKLKRLRRG